MPVSIRKLNAGDVLWKLWKSSSQRAGNITTVKTVWRPVYIREIASDFSYAMVSWNGSLAKVFPLDGKLPYRKSRLEKSQ